LTSTADSGRSDTSVEFQRRLGHPACRPPGRQGGWDGGGIQGRRGTKLMLMMFHVWLVCILITGRSQIGELETHRRVTATMQKINFKKQQKTMLTID